MKHLAVLLFYIGCITTVLAQENELTISVLPDSAISLMDDLEILVDESKVMTVHQVHEQGISGAFVPFKSAKFKGMLENGKFAYWYAISINFLGKEDARTVFQDLGGGAKMIYHYHNQILIDSFSVSLIREHIEQGNSKYAYRYKDIPITLRNGKNELLIRVTFNTTFHPLNVKLKLLKESLNITQKQKWHYLYFGTNGIFYGILIFVFLFTLVQYFLHLDTSFLFFALYILSFFLLSSRDFAMSNGYYIFYPTWMFKYDMHTPLHLAIYVTFIFFLKKILQTELNFPKLNNLLSYFLYGILIYFILERAAFYFVDTNLAYRMDKIFRPFLLSISFVPLFFLLKSKDLIARLIGYGTLSLIVFTLIGLLITYGNTPQNWIWWNKAYVLSKIGVLIELMLFSVALGQRTKALESEQNKIQLELDFKAKEAQQLKELDQLKGRFFTNITHEFRTPLTVIQGIAQQIQEKPTKDLNRRTALIQNNATDLLNMVNQLLDLSKKDFNQYTVQNIQEDVIKYLSYLTDSFYSLAQTKKINLSFHSQIDQQLMDFDPKVIQTLVTNLLGNAFKFTPEYGKIKVIAEVLSVEAVETRVSVENTENCLMLDFKNLATESVEHSDYLSLKVTDTGQGIARHHLPYIFDRFYQADAMDEKRTYGTGIGLALIKELMELLGGLILVDSQESIGSRFQLLIPIRNNSHLAEGVSSTNEITKKGEANSDPVVTQIPAESVKSHSINQVNKEKPLLLIVEDNADVIYYLKACLVADYELVVAMNGEEGIALAFQHIPDLILSDVMMPEIGGYELCNQLKNDARTSHIPIILLTAKVEIESKYKGLEAGADAYLTKPFDKKELLLRLENLVLLKKQMQLHLQLNSHIPPNQNSAIAPIASKELAFLQLLRSTVYENMNDEFFRAPQLAKAMMMSQTQLYRKIKALTNQSTAQYIKTNRLEKAKNLLETTDFSIGQVATEVGFKTQAHFTRSFQEEFGQLPSSTRK